MYYVPVKLWSGDEFNVYSDVLEAGRIDLEQICRSLEMCAADAWDAVKQLRVYGVLAGSCDNPTVVNVFP